MFGDYWVNKLQKVLFKNAFFKYNLKCQLVRNLEVTKFKFIRYFISN